MKRDNYKLSQLSVIERRRAQVANAILGDSICRLA